VVPSNRISRPGGRPNTSTLMVSLAPPGRLSTVIVIWSAPVVPDSTGGRKSGDADAIKLKPDDNIINSENRSKKPDGVSISANTPKNPSGFENPERGSEDGTVKEPLKDPSAATVIGSGMVVS